MSLRSLETRVADLERQLAALTAAMNVPAPAPPRDWRRTIGAFANDPVMEQIAAEGRKWREAERRKARAGAAKGSKPKGWR